MPAHFPPVGIVCNEKRRSRWREFGFMLRQVQQATDLPIKLENTLTGWGKITIDLAENSRKRPLQSNNIPLG